MTALHRIPFYIKRGVIKKINLINVKLYMKQYTNLLIKTGMNIAEYDGDGYIDPTAWIDGSDYSLITIGKNVTISREVLLLTHDFSIRKALKNINRNNDDRRYKIISPIVIGNGVFVGARATIMPGSIIGDNVIVGTCSLVKGELESGYVYAGVPAKKIGTIEEYANKWMDSDKVLG